MRTPRRMRARTDSSRTSLPQVIHRHAVALPAAAALVFPDLDGSERTFTYGQLDADAGSIAARLVSEGIEPGDVVALAMEHGYTVVAAFLGAMYVGAVPVILPYHNPGSSDRSYRQHATRLVRQVGAGTVLALPRSRAALADLGPEIRVLSVDPEDRSAPADRTPPFAPDPARTAYLQLSSGSTRTPRGVEIRHGALLGHVDALSEGFSFGADGVGVGWLPLHHDLGLVTQVLLPLAMGARSVLLAPQAWLRQPVSLLRAVGRYRGTFSSMPNFGFEHCLRRIDDADLEGLDLRSWRTLLCGGEAIRFGTMERFAARFASAGLAPGAIMAGYGMAENTLGVTHSAHGGGIRADRVSRAALEREGIAVPAAAGHPDAVEVVSCGGPFSGSEVGIADASDAPLPERVVGQIRIRGEALFAGYRDPSGATSSPVRNGWYGTGDRGYVAGGDLYVLGRTDDLIITAGRNVAPEEIEAVIMEDRGEDIRRAAAFGVRDDRLGTHVPIAVVEFRERVGAERWEEIAAAVRARVKAALEISLADVRAVETGWIQITTSGKVARNASRSKYLASGFQGAFTSPPEPGPAPSASASADELERELARIVAGITGRTDVDPHARLAELGLDSLMLVRVVLLIEERIGRTVPIEQMALDPTIARLARLLAPDGSGPAAAPSAADQEPLYPVGTETRPSLRTRLLRRGPILRQRPLLRYGPGSRVLHAIASRGGVRRRLFPAETDLLERWMERVPMAVEPEIAIRQSLMVNSWSGWRELALGEPAAFARWVTVRGAEILKGLAAERRGAVLVLPHTLLRRMLPRLPLIRQARLSIVGNIGAARLMDHGMPDLASAVRSGVPLSRTGVRSAQMVHALRTLGEGGRAMILSDDDEGSGGIELSFHGRMRAFRPGAAELAVRADAAFVPVFPSMDLEGRISFEFLPPLHAEGVDHAARVTSLLHAYASLLAERYTTDLGAMDWFILRKFVGDAAGD